MSRAHDHIFNAQSVVAEIPAYRVVQSADEPGEMLAALFRDQPRLPGVILTRDGQVFGALSRGQYLTAVGRFLGIELFHTRPISVMYSSLELDSHLMVLSGQCPIQEALHQCLKRPDKLVYEPFLVAHDETGDDIRMVDFQDLLMADSRVSALRNRQMEEILMTVTDGLLLMDENFIIQSEYSRAMEHILETPDLAGRSLAAVLRDSVEPQVLEKACDYFRTLFNPKVIERLIVRINPVSQVPVRFQTPLGPVTKHLRFSFMRSLREGHIHRVLVRVEDATRQIALAEELEQQGRRAEQRLELGFQLVRADAQLLADFLDSLERELTLAENAFSEAATITEPSRLRSVRDRLFRVVHGLKGEAGMLQLASFEKALHSLEDAIQPYQPTKTAASPETLAGLLRGLGRVRDLLNSSYGVIQQFRDLAKIGPGAAAKRGSEPAEAPARPTGILALIENMVRDQSAKLGVQARFHSHVEEADLPLRYRGLIKDCLVQFIRNSLAHGIEPGPERERHGKPAEASLQFILRPQEAHGMWEMIYQDDGRGLDLDRISQRLEELGYSWSNEEDLRQAIFLPGFSTAEGDDAAQLAGRGVGMDLVKHLVDAVGGYIQVHSAVSAYCAFQIVLPMGADVSTAIATATPELEEALT